MKLRVREILTYSLNLRETRKVRLNFFPNRFVEIRFSRNTLRWLSETSRTFNPQEIWGTFRSGSRRR